MDRIHSSDELEVCEEVGRGGFGVVYRGVVKATGTEVAIKQIDLEHELADLYEVNKEIMILSECRLPQITKYLGCFVKHYKLWVIMEFVNGGTFFEILQPGPVTDEQLIAVIAHEILVALDYLHSLGKIHRDLKSQNILLNQEGEVKLTDFGVSTQLSSNFSRRNTTVGTPYWMAPEVILNSTGGHSYKADIWSLGCCLYELKNGKPPLQEHFAPMKALRRMSVCKTDQDFLMLIDLDSATRWSDTFKDFLKKCFVVDPKERMSASMLLRHKFITQIKLMSEDAKKKNLRKLITRKHLWDQENHVTKTRRYYAPTEIALNQEKWRNGDTSALDKGNASIHFDFSTIHDLPNEEAFSPPSAPSRVLNKKEPSLSPAGSSIFSKNETPQANMAMKAELVKVLNRTFHKIELRAPLSTEQYDQLVSLNESLIELFLPIQYADGSSAQAKVLMCQYFKYFLKELLKQPLPDTAAARAQLQRYIFPSNLQNSQAEATKTRKTQLSAMDEIENSLLESWLDKMNNS